MKTKYVLATSLLFLFSSATIADEYTGFVKGFYVNNSNFALVRLENGQNTPSCGATDGWHFAFDASTDYGKQYMSMLLASRMSNTKIKVGYVPNQNNYCEVTYFYYWV